MIIRKTKTEMAEKYKEAEQGTKYHEHIMKKKLDKIDQYKTHICLTVIKMKESVNRLHEIALNKNVLTTDEYFDTLISSERNATQKKRMGKRVEQLESMKKIINY